MVILAFTTGYIVPRTYLKDIQEIARVYKEARDDEHLARVNAEKQRDDLLAQYAKTTVQVIESLPISSSNAVGVLDPGGDPDAAVAS
jgi:hypothetical protein